MIPTQLLKNIPHGFGTKEDGDGRDRKNIRTIAQNVSSPIHSIVIPGQTHSTHVAIITDKNTEMGRFVEIPNTDGLVTALPRVMLTVVTADCVPILYFDPVKQIIGISHGGWKGTLGKIPHHVIESMMTLGSNTEDILVSIGPSIGPCCYEIYGERLGDFREIYGDDVIKTRNNKNYLDLAEANVQTLSRAGVDLSHIEIIEECTSCNKASFFSYQRDQGIRGEMCSFLMLQEPF